MSITRVALCVLVLAGLVIATIRHFKSCLAYPTTAGHRTARWSGLWYLREVWKGHFEEWNIKAHASGGTYDW